MSRTRIRLVLAFAVTAIASYAVAAQDTPSPRATVNGDAVSAEELDARQYDLIAKDTIVKTVLDESRQLSRMPSVAQDLKSLMASVVQENPEANKEQIMAIVQERSVAYTQTLAVRRVKPKLFTEVEQQALDQLIDERLMLQEAQRQSVTVDEAEIDKQAAALPVRAGAEGEDLHKLLVAWDKRALPGAKARIKAQLAWTAALTKRLGASPDAATSAKELETLKSSAKIERN